MINVEGVELASGLVGLGRQWPPDSIKPIPTEEEADLFLTKAVNEGIRFFDTAPAYGSSEARLGNFLRRRKPKPDLIVATKVGEYWDPETNQSFVDHSFIGMKSSYQASKRKIGRIDILLLHKSIKSVINSSEFNEFAEYCLKDGVEHNGVEHIGASVSDVETAEAALNNSVISYLQLPYNHQSSQFREVIQIAQKMGKVVVVNRPFSSGRLFADISPADADQARIEAFSYILQDLNKGFILTGTTDHSHLRQNINAFNQALRQHR